MSQDLRLLLSAPYLIEQIDRFSPIFAGGGVEVLVAQVEERLEEDGLLVYAGQVDGVICGDDRFSATVLEAYSPRLKVISKWGTGIDSIDQSAAVRFGIRVMNTPDAFTEAVSDSVLGYMLGFARALYALDREMKSGLWRKRAGWALHERTLGVIGVGRIGRSVLSKARAFQMQLLGNDIVEIDPLFLQLHAVKMVSLEELMRSADFVSVNCDLNPSSRHLIGQAQLDWMKPDSVLINTARGTVIDEEALIRTLEMEKIGGAALDVFEHEPLPQESPLRTMDNVILAPHNANASREAWERVHKNTIRNLFLGLELTPPTFEGGVMHSDD
jgi:D-3-phosphoglycerate dehydrogenase